MSGKLYIVATPIGNLSDITLRALETLKTVDKIICEDTRVTLKLLNHFEIKKPLLSIHERTKPEKIDDIIAEIEAGKTMALVTDAGTPGVSDPGGLTISKATEAGIEVLAVPGPSAASAAFSLYDRRAAGYIFLGFFPKKKGRQTLLNNNKDTELPIMFFEAPTRIKKTLALVQELLGDRRVVVVRELTKKFETVYRGQISEVLPEIKEKGEIVVIIEGANGKK